MTGIEPLLRPPIGFGHRGAKAHAPENTLEAFRLGLRLGATGLESDVWLTADGVPVLDHDGRVRRRPIASVARADVPPSIPALSDLYAECGTDFELSLDIKDPDAAPAVVAAAVEAGAVERLWLCHHDVDQVIAWRQLHDGVKLVDSTRLRRIREGPERRAATLAAAGVDAINLHASDWTGGLTTLFHRFQRYAFGWDAQQERVLRTLLEMGIDGLYSDHVDRMTAVLAEFAR
jgi:glycerophosphoryl diester phosphodiesterase